MVMSTYGVEPGPDNYELVVVPRAGKSHLSAGNWHRCHEILQKQTARQEEFVAQKRIPSNCLVQES